MPEWGAAFWLPALPAVVALVWWLHRVRPPAHSSPVAAGFLWRAAPSVTFETIAERKADPAWRRRALCAGLIVLALASPSLPTGHADSVVVWFDNHPSMSASEAGRPRYVATAEALVEALKAQEIDTADVRLLRSPRDVFVIRSSSQDSLKQFVDWLTSRMANAAWIATPPPLARIGGGGHWLVSDGADRVLADWLPTAPLARVISIGSATENSALVDMSLRRSARELETFEGAVTLVNAGQSDADRHLVLRAGKTVILDQALVLAAGERRSIAFAMNLTGDKTPPAFLEARLSESDSLVSDDTLRLTLDTLKPLATGVSDTCGRNLRAALAAHPGLRVIDGEAPDFAVVCGGTLPAMNIGRVLWLPDTAAHGAIPASEPLALVEARDGALPPATINADVALTLIRIEMPLGFRPVLVSGHEPVVLRHREQTNVFASRLDFSAMAAEMHPQYAALVAMHVDIVSGRNRLDLALSQSRKPWQGAIAPRALAAATDQPHMTTATTSAALPLVLAALCVLLVDAWVRRRGHKVAGATNS